MFHCYAVDDLDILVGFRGVKMLSNKYKNLKKKKGTQEGKSLHLTFTFLILGFKRAFLPPWYTEYRCLA